MTTEEIFFAVSSYAACARFAKQNDLHNLKFYLQHCFVIGVVEYINDVHNSYNVPLYVVSVTHLLCFEYCSNTASLNQEKCFDCEKC